VDLKDKIIKALLQSLEGEYVRLEDDGGISGFVVSRQFQGMPTLDRQGRIEQALEGAPLAREERRRILMIAGLTPEEYEAVGARIRVSQVRELAGGGVEILVQGGLSDAEYVRGALGNQKGVQTTEPKPAGGAVRGLMTFRAKGPEGTPLTKEKALRVLKRDPYIEIVSNA
jgi:hypothetical protein